MVQIPHTPAAVAPNKSRRHNDGLLMSSTLSQNYATWLHSWSSQNVTMSSISLHNDETVCVPTNLPFVYTKEQSFAPSCAAAASMQELTVTNRDDRFVKPRLQQSAERMSTCHSNGSLRRHNVLPFKNTTKTRSVD